MQYLFAASMIKDVGFEDKGVSEALTRFEKPGTDFEINRPLKNSPD